MPRIYAYPTHLKGGEGRLKVSWPPVPDVPPFRVHAIETWLGDLRNLTRPMTVTPAVLAIICALYELDHPMPPRRALAEAIKCNIFSVDAAVSTSLGNGEITEEYRYEEGNVYGRMSIRRRRYLLPSTELFETYSSARRMRKPRAVPLNLTG